MKLKHFHLVKFILVLNQPSPTGAFMTCRSKTIRLSMAGGKHLRIMITIIEGGEGEGETWVEQRTQRSQQTWLLPSRFGLAPADLAHLQQTWLISSRPGSSPADLAHLQHTWLISSTLGSSPSYLAHLQQTWLISSILGSSHGINCLDFYKVRKGMAYSLMILGSGLDVPSSQTRPTKLRGHVCRLKNMWQLDIQHNRLKRLLFKQNLQKRKVKPPPPKGLQLGQEER